MMWMMLWSVAFAGQPRYDLLASPDGWKDVAVRHSDQGDVAVYTKTIDGLPCLMGVTSVSVPADKLLAVAFDIPSSKRWSSAGLAISETLAHLPDGGIDYFQYIDIPGWTMVYDRYWIMEGHTTSLGDARRFRWNRIDAATRYPAAVARAQAIESGAVEPPVSWGEWLFTPKNGLTEISYRNCVDVGGRLPMSIQTWVATRTMPDTVADLIREAKKH